MENESTVQVMVLTIESLHGDDSRSFTVKAFDHYGIGESDIHNGVLIMFAKRDQEIQIVTGKGIAKHLPDEHLGNILDTYAIPYFKDNRYSDGLEHTYKQMIHDIVDHYGGELDVEEESFELVAKDEQKIQKGKEYVMKAKQFYEKHPRISIAILVTLFLLYLRSTRRCRRNRYCDDGYYDRDYRSNRSTRSSRSSRTSSYRSSGGGGRSFGGGEAGRKW